MNAAGSEERGLPRIALARDLSQPAGRALARSYALHPSRTHVEHTAFFSAVPKLYTLLNPSVKNGESLSPRRPHQPL